MLTMMKPLCFLFCASLCLLTACVSETQRVDDPGRRQGDGTIPQQVLLVPQQLQDTSGDLLRYHAKHHVLPPTLEVLIEEGILSPEAFADLPNYAYHPQGLGVIADGRTVILVDAMVRIEGHVWCIVRSPDGAPRTIQLNVTPIELSELESAARRGQ